LFLIGHKWIVSSTAGQYKGGSSNGKRNTEYGNLVLAHGAHAFGRGLILDQLTDQKREERVV
jgi:hypothetical protein